MSGKGLLCFYNSMTTCVNCYLLFAASQPSLQAQSSSSPGALRQVKKPTSNPNVAKPLIRPSTIKFGPFQQSSSRQGSQPTCETSSTPTAGTFYSVCSLHLTFLPMLLVVPRLILHQQPMILHMLVLILVLLLLHTLLVSLQLLLACLFWSALLSYSCCSTNELYIYLSIYACS
uniref:Uncharacterized protein n=1 Tax=Opuntia streptacantha TaxID=393608 RepID=A0A7C9ENF7_OPUST